MRNKPVVISDLSLAAALASIGIPFYKHDDESPPFIKVKNQRGYSYSFFFEEQNEDGDQTQPLIDAWYDDDWVDNNKDHPYSFVKCAFKNRETLLDIVNQSASLVVLEKGNKFALISSNAPDEIKEKVFSRL